MSKELMPRAYMSPGGRHILCITMLSLTRLQVAMPLHLLQCQTLDQWQCFFETESILHQSSPPLLVS